MTFHFNDWSTNQIFLRIISTHPLKINDYLINFLFFSFFFFMKTEKYYFSANFIKEKIVFFSIFLYHYYFEIIKIDLSLFSPCIIFMKTRQNLSRKLFSSIFYIVLFCILFSYYNFFLLFSLFYLFSDWRRVQLKTVYN